MEDTLVEFIKTALRRAGINVLSGQQARDLSTVQRKMAAPDREDRRDELSGSSLDLARVRDFNQ
jgi:hypothetical protein